MSRAQILGPVASARTVWRALDELIPAAWKRVEKARAKVRRHVWAQLAAGAGVPASKVAGTDLGETVVLDVDATLVTVHSEKESAAATFNRSGTTRSGCGATTARRCRRRCCGRGPPNSGCIRDRTERLDELAKGV